MEPDNDVRTAPIRDESDPRADHVTDEEASEQERVDDLEPTDDGAPGIGATDAGEAAGIAPEPNEPA
jgi:hypothetical protein